MLPIQPPLIPTYFTNRSSQLSSQTKKISGSFFLSWEDALWHLLKIHKIKKNAVVLVPEFFCGDVTDNMNSHGLQHIHYNVDKYLQPNESDFINKLQKNNPAVVVIFHSIGITNPLLKNSKEWLEFLPKKTILIEDCVHKVVDPQAIKFATKNHYVIDSLRKVVPVQGSWVYSVHPIPKIPMKTNLLTAWYRLQVFFWWVLMELFLNIAYYTKSKVIQKYGNICAEFAMKKGYDVIGDQQLPACGIPGMAWMSNRLNIVKIYDLKRKQAQLYKNILQKTKKSKYFFYIPISEPDFSQLRGFPLGLELQYAEFFLRFVRENGLLLRFELNDSPWSKKQKIVYLPMGLHVRSDDIQWVCEVLNKFQSTFSTNLDK